MANPSSFRKRPVFKRRPWITGQLYENMARTTVLHCDAYVRDHGHFKALLIEWTEGGGRLIARDVYLVESDGLTPMWDDDGRIMSGLPVYWTPANDDVMRRLHARVLLLADDAEGRFARWPRVSLLAHYVHVKHTDCEIPASRNKYAPPKAYKARERKATLPDWL